VKGVRSVSGRESGTCVQPMMWSVRERCATSNGAGAVRRACWRPDKQIEYQHNNGCCCRQSVSVWRGLWNCTSGDMVSSRSCVCTVFQIVWVHGLRHTSSAVGTSRIHAWTAWHAALLRHEPLPMVHRQYIGDGASMGTANTSWGEAGRRSCTPLGWWNLDRSVPGANWVVPQHRASHETAALG
jgi:hypothetical protein